MRRCLYDKRCKSSGHPRKIPSLDVPFATPSHRPMYVTANTAAPQLTWGVMQGESVVAQAWRIRYLNTEFPCDPQNMTYPNNHSR